MPRGSLSSSMKGTLAAKQVPVVMIDGKGQVSTTLKNPPRHAAVQHVVVAVHLELESRGQRQIATAGPAGHDQLADAVLGLVGIHVFDGLHAVVQAGGERMRTLGAG